MKIIIYPGSFDPLHNGHLLIARKAKEKIGADQVLFLLSPSTVWKKVITSYKHRQNMLEAGLDDLSFKVSTIEEQNEGKTNYTYITIKTLRKLNPHAELFLLIGEDQAAVFDKWKNPDEIVKEARILVYKRAGSKLSSENYNRFNMLEIEGPLSPTSSSKVRNFESIDVPSAVLEYIGENKLYFTNRINKLMSDKRYFHSFSVAKLSRLIAIANDLDPLKAFQAGFLHDIGKEVPDAKTMRLMEGVYKEYLDLPSWSYHQFIGAYLTRHEFFISDNDILEAIMFHATGNKKMSSLAKAVYVADKIEPTRGFDSSVLINDVMQNLDQGFLNVLLANKLYLQENGNDYNNRLTKACFTFYLK